MENYASVPNEERMSKIKRKKNQSTDSTGKRVEKLFGMHLYVYTTYEFHILQKSIIYGMISQYLSFLSCIASVYVFLKASLIKITIHCQEVRFKC